ncbi:hypothetical protein KVG96_19560 [Pseudomonas sp. COR58]|uniref:DUF3077 domain-containing protein n=1 Tax=Pseudomonas ekonensis TaxID=2842353 RepID=A0ABS6PIY2_9PSED|nr:DUF6124 family protein [Pseudomonas ekonensis]MBV4460159.1 hypothetical protein [Pseudomonas ekonensis]
MFKPTPNPPESDPTSPYESPDSRKLNEAAERALDHYLNPTFVPEPALKISKLYAIAPAADNEELLADACETLTSAKVMANNFAGLLDGQHRHTAQGIAQLIMLGELAVNRVLDSLELKADATL